MHNVLTGCDFFFSLQGLEVREIRWTPIKHSAKIKTNRRIKKTTEIHQTLNFVNAPPLTR